MSTRYTPRTIIGICVLLLACIGVYLLIERTVEQQSRAATFFAAALRNANISESVSVGGIEYEVNDGVISSANKSLSAFNRYRVLRLAYELALVRRAPLFGIAGVDPQELTTAVQQLSVAQGALADAQVSPRDALLVRQALYPVDFLNDLASLEHSRLAFIASGSDLDATRYEIALKKTIFDGISNAKRFRDAFNEEAGTDQFKFPTLGGTISRATLFNSIAVMNSRFIASVALLQEREHCLSGNTSSCRPQELDLTSPENDRVDVNATSPAPQSTLPSDQGGTTNLLLSQSSCLGMLPGPYVFSYGNPSGTHRMPLWFSGDSFFTPTAGIAGATMQYLRQQQHIEYSLVNPLEFYICPDVLSDIGSAYALLSTVKFAQAHPEFAKMQRASLLSHAAFRETDALAYLREATAEITAEKLPESDAAQSGLENLLNLWREQSAGLDMLVSTMAQVDKQDAGLHAQGVPFDVSAKTLFLTHSAFPSLMLTQNLSAGTSTISLREADAVDFALLSLHMIPYSTLLKTVPREQLTHDLNTFLSFEGIAAP